MGRDAPTVMAEMVLAGDLVQALVLSLPAATTMTILLSTADWTASLMAVL